MNDDLIVQRPATPQALLLMFHGFGATPDDLVPLGQALAPGLPQHVIASVRAPQRGDFGSGWQWFGVQGVSEANRPARVAAALPAFAERVRAWQRETGVGAAGTTLLGFSQGAIMALESTQRDGEPLAARVIAIAGRFAEPPRRVPNGAVHLLHGDADGVMPVALAADAQAQLAALGAAVTLERFAGLGHGIDARVLAAVARLLA